MPAKLTEDETRARRDEILSAAARVFAEQGYEGATIRDLEPATGLTRGGIFFHFPGKRALYLAVLRKSLLEEPLAREVPFIGRLAASAGSAEESLLATYHGIMEWHRDHPEAMTFFQQLEARSAQEQDLATAEAAFRKTCGVLDKIACTSTLHRNTVARRKSRLARRLNALKTAASA